VAVSEIVAEQGDKRKRNVMKTKKKGNNWTAYYDPDTNRYFAEIMYTSREGREQYDYEIREHLRLWHRCTVRSMG
jgi:hypothetical protein